MYTFMGEGTLEKEENTKLVIVKGPLVLIK